MLSKCELEAVDWYFRIYTRLSIINLSFNHQNKYLEIPNKLRDRIYVFLLWLGVQTAVPAYLLSVYCLINSPNPISSQQILFFTMYLMIYFVAFIPSYIMATNLVEMADSWNMLISSKVIIQGEFKTNINSLHCFKCKHSLIDLCDI